jgi:amidase
VQAVVERLRDLGHEVVEREIGYTVPIAANVIARYLGGIADEGRRIVTRPERISRRSRGYIRMGSAIPAGFVERAKAAATADAAELDRVFDGGVDAVITPMFTRRPPRVGEYEGRPALWSFTGSVRFVPYCGGYNHTGQPAASIPATWTADGFPVGAQLVVPPHAEPVLLSLAAQLERELGWLERRPEAAR